MSRKILVVDENEPDLELLITQIFRKKIQSHELEFIFARRGSDAFLLLQQDPHLHIVLMDVKLEKGGGQDLLGALSKLKRLLKVVVITPYGDIESIRVAMNKGAFDFITRPLNLQDVELTLMKTLKEVSSLLEAEKTQSKLLDMENELEVAKNIQTSILPHDFNPIPGVATFQIFGSMLPAKGVGGDFYDFFPLDDKLLAFTIADVSGKGVPAALFMTMTRGLIRALGQKTRSPMECFKQLNELIALENESVMFVTAFYGLFNVETGEISYCNAGHNPPYLITTKGELSQIGRFEGIALGVVKEGSYFQQNHLKLNPGDQLLLYTDGVIEAMNPENELYQESRFEEEIKKSYTKPLSTFLNSIVTSVQAFSSTHEQSDDITLLGIRYCPEGEVSGTIS